MSEAPMPDGRHGADSSGTRRARRRRRWLLWVAGLVWSAVALTLALHVLGRAVDDVFITYRYADNLARGRGLVFNPGERVFGTTAPGMALLLGALAAVSRLPVNDLGTLVTGATLVGIALLLLRAGEAGGRTLEALVAGCLLVTASGFWVLQGSETPLALLLLLTGAALARRAPGLAGASAGLAVWLRPEAALGAALLVLLRWREARRPPWRLALVAGAVVAAGILLAWLWFGDIVPATLRAKRLQGSVYPPIRESLGAGFWRAALINAASYWTGLATWPLICGGAAGLLLLARHGGRVGRLLGLYALGLALAYPLLGVAPAPWYVLPVAVALIAGYAFAAGAVARAVAQGWPGWPGRGLGALALLICVLPVAAAIAPLSPRKWEAIADADRFEAYRETGEWLRASTPPEAEISYLEVGTIAYFSDRPVQDLLGLVSPRSLPFLEQRDLLGAFLARPTEIVLRTEGLSGFLDLSQYRWFRRSYAEAARFRHPPWPDVVVYRRLPGSRVPPPRPPIKR
ncbi:MAG TPA: hypothetical protein VFE44_03000 [Thermoanaerobaculia bacterium]|nr:hypothetical protein [Thermoanaerobaculia bacterium]